MKAALIPGQWAVIGQPGIPIGRTLALRRPAVFAMGSGRTESRAVASWSRTGEVSAAGRIPRRRSAFLPIASVGERLSRCSAAIRSVSLGHSTSRGRQSSATAW